MTTFTSFTPITGIAPDVIEKYARFVSADIVDAWREHGTGFVADGYFRLVDPARASEMLEGVISLPEGAVILLSTALGDLIAVANGVFLVIKSRLGAIDVIPESSFSELVSAIEDPDRRETIWEWQPYPLAQERDGTPALEQCFGYVPLLALGGDASASSLQRSGLYEHLAVIAQLAGPPQVRRILDLSA